MRQIVLEVQKGSQRAIYGATQRLQRRAEFLNNCSTVCGMELRSLLS